MRTYKDDGKRDVALYLQTISLLLTTIAVLVLTFQLATLNRQVTRAADALNESNHIMVGVENGNVPGAPRRFDHAPPARSF